MDLRDVDLYIKVRAKATHAGTPAEEAAVAQRRMRELETSFPGIAARADWVTRVMTAEGNPFKAPPSGSGNTTAANPFGEIVERVLGPRIDRFAEGAVDVLAGKVSGADRWTELKPGEVRISKHECPTEQVCIEVRVLRSDLLRRGDVVLDVIGRSLAKRAQAR